MKWFVDRKINLYERFMLLFCREKKHIDYENNRSIVYKVFNGVIYILKVNYLPPSHPNCRCDVVPK